MTLKIHWYLPTGGDVRSYNDFGHVIASEMTTGSSYRAPSWEYMSMIARTADSLGYEAMLTPCGFNNEDAWITTAALMAETRDIKFMVAFRPGLINPVLAAQAVTTYQRMSNNRLLLNIVPGADGPEAERYGDWLDKAQRMAQAGEFMEVMRAAWGPDPVDYEGTYYRTKGTTIPAPEVQPRIYFGGSSGPSGEFAATYADTYLTWAEPVEQVGEKLEWMRGLAASKGRHLEFGLRVHVLARDTSEEAWEGADRLLRDVPDSTIERAQAILNKRGSVGQSRLRALTGGKRENVVVAPNLWAGSSLIRGGVGTTIVGSHEEVADRIEDYMRVGISEFVLSGYPHVEEAHWFAEGVMPILRRRGLFEQGSKAAGVMAGAARAASN